MAQIGTLRIPDIFPGHVTARQVFGNELTGDGIEHGDFLIIDPCREHEDGDIAVVTFMNPDGTFTEGVRHARRDGTMLILTSSNPVCPPIVVTPDRKPMIAGVVVGRVRHMNDRADLVRRLK